MRILRVIRSVNRESGGPIEALLQTSAHQESDGHRIEVATLDRREDPWVAEFPFKIYAFGPGGTGYGYSPRFVPWLKRHSGDYDAVVVSGLWQFQTLGALRALKGSAVPFFVFPHGMLDPWFKERFPIKHLKKCLYWSLAEHRVLRRARSVLFTSDEERLRARKSFRPYRCRETVVAYGTGGPEGNMASQRAEFLARNPDLIGRRILLFMGRIHEKKGCDLLIRAFAKLLRECPTENAKNQWRLVLAGPDQVGLRNRLEVEAERLEVVRNIHWLGMLTGDQKWGAFHAAEAFVLPSHQENFGVAVAEALACGLPVLISDKVNIWREIECDGAGLIGSDDQPGTDLLLRRWAETATHEQSAMRQAARRCFATRFDAGRAARHLAEVLVQ